MADQSSQSLSRFWGPYECLAKLGAGGMGSVYRARHRDTGAVVALKIASRRVVTEPILAIRFQNEYEATRHLQHPRLVRALEYGKEQETPYLVMEYVPGQSLDQKIRAKGKLGEDEVVRLARQVGEVLEFIHERNVIHRDIKPGNILLTESGEAMLADLGLVKNLEGGHALTRSSTGLGTMEYAAPEQFDNAKHADARADIYSLAATLYKALTGLYPFGKGGQITILNRKMANAFTPLSEACPGVSPHVNKAVAQALQFSTRKRPATVAEFMNLLTGGVAQPPTPKAAPPPGAAGEWRERRASVRYPVTLPSSCQSVHPSTQGDLPAVVQDISAHGMCVCLARRFEAGAVLQVRVQGTTNAEFETTFVVQVRWLRRLSAEQWLLGCAFTTPLSGNELETFCFNGSAKTNLI